jgi:hypothetical protein
MRAWGLRKLSWARVQVKQARERGEIHMGRRLEWKIHIFALRAVFTWNFLDNKGVLSVEA